MMAAKMRLDVYLTEKGYYRSRRAAKGAIESGLVRIGGKTALKPSAQVPAAPMPGGDALRVEAEPFEQRFVGRGGYKLDAALDAFGIDVEGMAVLDVGASTGGFTDCLLQRGAAAVFALDAGVGQLHASLRGDPRVVPLEKTNARLLAPRSVNGGRNDMAVVDVSFISLEKVLLPIREQLKPAADIVCLVKPQFEVGPQNVGKRGVVRARGLHESAVGNVEAFACGSGMRVMGKSESPIAGGGGNREFFLWLKARPPE
jgi:23S rRNA (cytidine1920-2'-O)/16S rRNA (cytidine1409-2'-O)-methyltransferase